MNYNKCIEQVACITLLNPFIFYMFIGRETFKTFSVYQTIFHKMKHKTRKSINFEHFAYHICYFFYFLQIYYYTVSITLIIIKIPLIFIKISDNLIFSSWQHYLQENCFLPHSYSWPHWFKVRGTHDLTSFVFCCQSIITSILFKWLHIY